jgi:hypothetical protein
VTATEAPLFEGPERGHQGLGKRSFEDDQGLEHVPVLIPLSSLPVRAVPALTLEVLQFFGLQENRRPRACSFDEVVQGEEPLCMASYRPILPVPV